MEQIHCGIGFRASPKQVDFAVIHGSRELPILVDSGCFKFPDTFTFPESLAWLRVQIETLFVRHCLAYSGLRIPENNARSLSPERFRVEGVLMEVCSSKGISVFLGPLASIGSRIGSSSSQTKKSLDEVSFRELDWSTLRKEAREAIMVATAALGEI